MSWSWLGMAGVEVSWMLLGVDVWLGCTVWPGPGGLGWDVGVADGGGCSWRAFHGLGDCGLLR